MLQNWKLSYKIIAWMFWIFAFDGNRLIYFDTCYNICIGFYKFEGVILILCGFISLRILLYA